MKKSKNFLFSVLILILSLLVPALSSADDFISSRVKDISDRSYEEAVIDLLDNARESIVISMYSISLGTKGNNPVKLLLNDLLEARERGVSVTLYLNTRFRDVERGGGAFMAEPAFKKLEEAGCLVQLIPSHRRLHDKLIIVDSRYVVEGSANWSITALKNNFESSTLIDSPELARIKLARLENLLILSQPRLERVYTPEYLENLPESLTISKELLLNKQYFSAMLSRQDSRALDLYLLLLAHRQATGKEKFFISLESMALSLGMPDSWSYTALRRQAIKSLKKLQGRYRLIEVKFFFGRDALITFKGVPGDSFSISVDSIIQAGDNRPPMRLKFLLLVEALLKDEGEDLSSFSCRSLARRFNVSDTVIRAALRDYEKME